ncbi:hypothetical protein BGZ75_005101 [Mortierella antarctica]|nr:hypothetical protein BGZ75_005101 [Mortierella antarctica]
MAQALTAQSTSFTYRLYSLQSVTAQAYATLRRQLTSVLFSSSLVGGHAPNPGDTEMSTPWLRNTLISAGALPKDATVVSVECKGLDGNRGLCGVMTRVLVTYTLNSGDDRKDSHDLNLILKKSGDGRRHRLGNIVSGQVREAIFYSSDLAKTLLPSTLLPKVYYAHGSQWLGEYVILMEDIKQRGAAQGIDSQKPIDVNFVFGNQIWGLPDSIKSLAPPAATAMLDQMFLTAAEMHSQHWNDSRLLQQQWGWLKFASWYRGSGRTQWEWSVQAGLRGWEKGKQKAASGELSVQYSEKFVRILDESFKRASWERLQKRLQDKREPFTLIHGDFHAANMILDRSTNASSAVASSSSTSSSSIVMYDWSEVCVWEPTTDLGQTVISDVAIPVFQAHARIALKKYWERLIELGATKAVDYPFETCWKAFLRGGVEKWLWTFAILCNYPGMPASLVQYFHDQLLAFIELADNGGEEYYDITTVCLFPPPDAS